MVKASSLDLGKEFGPVRTQRSIQLQSCSSNQEVDSQQDDDTKNLSLLKLKPKIARNSVSKSKKDDMVASMKH